MDLVSVKWPQEAFKNPMHKSEVEKQPKPSEKEKLSLAQSLNHNGEVNKARYMPQSFNIVATKTVSAEIHIFDLFKHHSRPEGIDHLAKPNLRLLGHTEEGYGLSWNTLRYGTVASGSNDGRICVWDVSGSTIPERDNLMEPLQSMENAHRGQVVDDVCWSHYDESVIFSVGDDKSINVWDCRSCTPCSSKEDAHTQEIMSVDASPFDQNIIVTGSMDGLVSLWDCRNLSQALHSFKDHEGDVTQTKFASLHPSLLASSGSDKQVLVWDISKIGEESELMFVHAGHTARVSDISWNSNEKLTLASVSEDNII